VLTRCRLIVLTCVFVACILQECRQRCCQVVVDWASDGLWPDLVIFRDVPDTVARERLARSGVGPDRLEAAGDEFHRRVAVGFRTLAAACPDTWRVVDGRGVPDEVAAEVMEVVSEFFAA
jgi:thymidylate kinase